MPVLQKENIYSEYYATYQFTIRLYLSKCYFAYLLNTSINSIEPLYEKILKDVFKHGCSFIKELLEIENYTLPTELENFKEEIQRYYEFGDINFLAQVDKVELNKAIKKAVSQMNLISLDHLENCFNLI